jgi:hypothetical protein
MNLLCPNCQKPLQVEDHHAGQPMRCPLCNGIFTVPGLPTPAAAATPVAAVSPASEPPADVYSFRPETSPPTPTQSAPSPSPLAGSETLQATPPPPPVPPHSPPAPFVEGEPTFPSIPVPEGYSGRFPIWLSPSALQYVAPAAVLLIFFLQFFSWVGVYPGGVASAWQNAWQSTVGYWSFDRDAPQAFEYLAKVQDADKGKDKKDEARPVDDRPGWNPLVLFYLLLFFPTLALTIGCLALSFVPPSSLPPAVHPLLPWRWGIVAAANLVVFLFLALQLLIGFSLENNKRAAIDAEIARMEKAQQDGKAATTAQQMTFDVLRGVQYQALSRTVWLKFVVFLHILAITAAGLMFWLNRRGARPAPQIAVLW